ncbi:MAG: N-acetylmuramoyl-L-alanine amidase [Gemmatimonadaceae bacterium]|nr:N-acetylmuramoyl-L-alanine amidase [Gemmatimonadaceae bacterium]
MQSSRLCAVLLLAVAGCRSGSVPLSSPVPASASRGAQAAAAPGLPPVPRVVGAPLAIRVQYPGDNQLITSRDSNFVLGTVGSSDVQLVINGARVVPEANGAFIAWLPNPSVSEPSYTVILSRGADTVRRVVRVRYPSRVLLPASGPLLADTTSVQPLPGVRALPDEWIRVSVRAAANTQVQLELADGMQRALVPQARIQQGVERAADGIRDPFAVANAAQTSASDAGQLFATEVRATQLTTPTRLRVTRDSVVMVRTVPAVEVLAATTRWLGVLRTNNLVGSDTDRVVHARTIADGTYKWLLFPGTVVDITGRQGGSTRVRLDDALDVWVDNGDVVPLPVGSAAPRRVTGGIRVLPAAEWVDVIIGTGDRPAFLVEPDGRTLALTLYGVQLNPEISPILGNDTLVRRISWDQVGSQRARVTFTLSQPTYGWLSLWDEQRRAFVLRIRRAPRINSAARPLEGLTIAVDPGHPPAGATGPTGLYEGDAVLPVSKLLVELLRARGALPVITRETAAAVGLTERGVASRRANAHAFVSVHLNALPDGVNPFTANGTSTLFFHQHSEALARPVQSAMVASFGLRDLGVHYQNLAVARPTWYPSILTEGLFLMMPEQEAAVRDPAFQRRYAQAIVDGLEQYFRSLRAP